MCHERVQGSAVHIQRQETPLLSGCVMRAGREQTAFQPGLGGCGRGACVRKEGKVPAGSLLAAPGGEMSGALTGCEVLEGRDWVWSGSQHGM